MKEFQDFMNAMDSTNIFARKPREDNKEDMVENTLEEKKEGKILPQLDKKGKEDMVEHKLGEKKEEDKVEHKREEKKEEEKKEEVLSEEVKKMVQAEVMQEIDHLQLLAGDLKEHPWAVRPWKKGRSHDLSALEQERLKMEETAARKSGMTWQERGPAQDPYKDRPEYPNWRGQPYRQGLEGGKKRYAKRGGANKEYYQKLAKAGYLKPGPKGAVRLSKPMW